MLTLKQQMKIKNYLLFSFVALITLSILISFSYFLNLNLVIAIIFIIIMAPLLWWKQVLLYKLIADMDIHVYYMDPKTNQLKNYDALYILDRLNFLKNPFKHEIVIHDLAFIDSEKSKVFNLDLIFIELYLLKVDENEETLDLSTSDKMITQIISDVLKLDVVVDNFEDLENFLKSHKKSFLNVKTKGDFLNVLFAFGEELKQQKAHLDYLELKILKPLINYYKNEKTVLLDILISSYIILFNFMYLITFQNKQEKEIKYLSSGLHISNFIQKIMLIKTACETEMIIKYSSKAQMKSQICFNKSFGELNFSKKILTLTPIPNFTNINLVRIQNELAQELDLLTKQRVLLETELKTLDLTKAIKGKEKEISKLDIEIKKVTHKLAINGYSIPLHYKK